MVTLGIDYGNKKIGLAIASGPLAEPFTQLANSQEVIKKISQICQRLKVQRIVIGISEGEMAIKTKQFAKKTERIIGLPIIFQDETLTTKLAIRKLREAKAKKKKRFGPKHAFAATLILQDFLDQQETKRNRKL